MHSQHFCINCLILQIIRLKNLIFPGKLSYYNQVGFDVFCFGSDNTGGSGNSGSGTGGSENPDSDDIVFS